jgi:hypothetical protein
MDAQYHSKEKKEASKSSRQTKKSWSSLQFWYLVKLLAEHECVSYDAVRQHPLFDGNEEALRGMERAELIHLERRHGRPYAITPAKSIHRVAFKNMCNDKRLDLWMRSRILNVIRDRGASKVARCEEELKTLSEIVEGLHHLPVMRERAVLGTLESRIRSITTIMQIAAEKVSKYELEMEAVRKQLSDPVVSD